MHGKFMAWPNENSLWRSSKIYRHIFSQFDGKYFTGDGVEETKMAITGSQVELMT